MLKRSGKSRCLWLFLTIFGSSVLAAQREPEALALLDRAVDAARAVDTVKYRFESGGPGQPFGWVTGEVAMKRQNRYDDSWIRVRGMVREMPQPALENVEFAFATDGERAYSLDHAKKRWLTAMLDDEPDAATRLVGFAAWGILREFVEHKPYWMELGSAEVLRLEAPATFAGVACHVLHAVFDAPQGKMELRWYLGRADDLPRGQVWSNKAVGQAADFTFTIHDLRLGAAIEREAFQLVAPAGFQRVYSDLSGARVGEPAPDWRLTAHTGEQLSLERLRGKVVVMDFWNSSCYLCHNLMPGIQALHEELGDKDVVVLGFNVWEPADPAAYWKKRGFTYRFLLQSDAVAKRYGIVAQPSVVVVGRDGKVVFSLLGAVPDRAASIRAAVETALAEPKGAVSEGG